LYHARPNGIKAPFSALETRFLRLFNAILGGKQVEARDAVN